MIATPLLLFMVMAIVQFALWSHATHIAQATAAQGLATARVQDATAAQGEVAARHLIDQLGHGPLTHARIDAARGLMQGHPTPGPILATLVWTVTILAVTVPVAVHRLYRLP